MDPRDLRKWISLAVLLAAAVAGALWGWARWRHGQVFVATDNAYVRGHVVAVSSRVPGPLAAVAVDENQAVAAGQLLASIDPRDYDAAADRAEASIAEAASALALHRAQIAQAEAQLEAARSQRRLAGVEKARLAALWQRDSLPRQKLDQAETAEQVAAAQVTAAEKQVAAAHAALELAHRRVAVATSAAEQARLQRSYCDVTAPTAGYVSRKLAEPGMVVGAGQPLLAIVPLDTAAIWIEANFKETQLRDVRPGQKARLEADIDEGRVFTGTVESIAAGTGSVFSLLPAENATGNWVKVVQRVPVRIRIDPDSDPGHRLRLGLSVRVEIDTRSN
jgi:membrane fusion protein (multidrug efflux system)